MRITPNEIDGQLVQFDLVISMESEKTKRKHKFSPKSGNS